MGKRKIEMKLITDERKRMTTFTKRRKGLFKKAQELSTLCGCEIAIVTFSRAGKPYAFASPPGAGIFDRYLNSKNNTIDKYDNLHHSQNVIDACQDEHDLHQLKCALEILRDQVSTRLHQISLSPSSSAVLWQLPVPAETDGCDMATNNVDCKGISASSAAASFSQLPLPQSLDIDAVDDQLGSEGHLNSEFLQFDESPIDCGFRFLLDDPLSIDDLF